MNISTNEVIGFVLALIFFATITIISGVFYYIKYDINELKKRITKLENLPTDKYII